MGAPESSRPAPLDVAVVGGGLSGTLAALVLARAGHRVALVDRHDRRPQEFRVEKISGDQIGRLERLGLLDLVARSATRFDTVANMRGGRLVDRTRSPHFGILYPDLVAAARAALPASVQVVTARATGIATGPRLQTVSLRDREPLTARLVVLATGMGDSLRRGLGIGRRVLHARQSLTFGFDVALEGGRPLPDGALTCYGEDPADGIDYLALFPIGTAIRANLFTFRDHRDPWVEALRQAPARTLRETLPGFDRALGAFDVAGPVRSWVMDIAVAQNCRQDGVVLVGDAFQTSCPAAGTGVSRLLSDIERLCTVHVPGWFATPGMGREKIAAFYDDAAKKAVDAHAIELANYRRSLTIGTGLGWRARRQVQRIRRRAVHHVERLSPALVARARALRPQGA